MGSIYLIRNEVNNKCYIGQTTRKVKERVDEHIKKKKGNLILARAVRRYGIDNFSFETLQSRIPHRLLGEKEKHYIKKHKTLSPHGYNLTEGGDGVKQTPEIRRKISKSLKGRRFSNSHKQALSKFMKQRPPIKHTAETRRKMSEIHKGAKLSEETKKKMSRNKRGKLNPNYGKPRSAKDKKKISETKKNTGKGKDNAMYGRKHTAEAKRKMSESRKLRS